MRNMPPSPMRCAFASCAASAKLPLFQDSGGARLQDESAREAPDKEPVEAARTSVVPCRRPDGPAAFFCKFIEAKFILVPLFDLRIRLRMLRTIDANSCMHIRNKHSQFRLSIFHILFARQAHFSHPKLFLFLQNDGLFHSLFTTRRGCAIVCAKDGKDERSRVL